MPIQITAAAGTLSGTVGLDAGVNSIGTVGLDAGVNSAGTVGLDAGVNSIGAVTRTTGAYQQPLGIESGLRGNYKLTPDNPQRQVGMMGEVWANVSDEGGDIAPGDQLVSATAPGVLMKADTKDVRYIPGVVVGRANAAFLSAKPDREYGKILVWIRPM